MTIARFRTAGRFDMASALQQATVEVDRDVGLVRVRPLRRRRVYVMPLSAVAEWIVRRTIAAEVAEKRRLRGNKAKGARRARKGTR